MEQQGAGGRDLFEKGNAAYQNGNPSTAQALLEAAVNSFVAEHNLRGTAAALTNLGAAYAATRNFRQAIDALERAVSMHRETGERVGLAMATFSLAATLTDCGMYFAALRRFREAIQPLELIGNKPL